MKWLSVLIVALAGILSYFSPEISAEAADMLELQAITHSVLPEARESITFKLSGKAVPKMFTMDGGNPRLILDFPGCSYAGKSVVPLPQSKLATAVRIGMHQTPEQKVRVVVDLAKDIAVKHTLHEYAEGDQTLTVELAAVPAEQQKKGTEAKEPAAGQSSETKTLPGAEELAAKPLNEKPVPPPLHRKEVKEESPVQEKIKGAAPQLLDITFDDSSKKGEMVLFHLSDFYPPTVSAVEKDTPRVFCQFTNMSLGAKVQENIAAKGKYVQRIRTTKHKKPDKVQVVLELSPDYDYDLQQVFFKNDNLFVLIVNELAPEKKAGE